MKKVVKEEEVKVVINKQYYDEYIHKKQELLDDESRFYYAKTDDVKFDFWQPYSYTCFLIRKSNIEDYEVKIIEEKAKEYQGKRNRLSKLKFLAYKSGNNDESTYKGILNPYTAQLLGLFGKFNSVPEVHKIITTQWGLPCSFETVEKFRNNNYELILTEQDKYVKDWSNLKLVYKKSRLDEYSGLYENRKIKYDETQNREDYKLLLQTLEAIRKEVEGERLTLDGNLEVNVQQTINLHIQQDVLKNLNILQFIIARVAVRLGLDSAFLMQRLQKSYYSKFTGFEKPDNNRNTDEIYYPSRELYDFDRIEIENAKIVEEEQQVVLPLPEVKEEIIEVKNNLLEVLLRKKREAIEMEKKLTEVQPGNVVIKKKQKRNNLKNIKIKRRKIK